MIGCGDVAEVKSGPGFQKANRSRLVAVMRRDGTKAADFARRHGVPRWYDNADALIADPEIDAVYVATPPDAHLDNALKVAAAGKPAYVEKPMARNTAECDAMIRAFRDRGLPLFTAYYRRALPRFLLVKEILAQGKIGRVTGIHYSQAEGFHRRAHRWHTTVAISGGGHFCDVGSHVLDLLDDFFGPLKEVAGTAANLASDYAPEDSVAMSFKTSSGIPGSGSWNFASAVKSDVLRIAGTEGQMEFAVFDASPIRLETAAGAQVFPGENPAHVHQPLIQQIVEDLLGVGICVSTGDSGRRTNQVMDTVLSGYYGGRHDAFWKRSDSWPGPRR
jgi:1,5-anhydro-D-fructose reductase (1,5-anhydro-D-mannitol-forming)